MKNDVDKHLRSLKLISPEIPSLKIYLEVSQVLWNLIKREEKL